MTPQLKATQLKAALEALGFVLTEIHEAGTTHSCYFTVFAPGVTFGVQDGRGRWFPPAGKQRSETALAQVRISDHAVPGCRQVGPNIPYTVPLEKMVARVRIAMA